MLGMLATCAVLAAPTSAAQPAHRSARAGHAAIAGANVRGPSAVRPGTAVKLFVSGFRSQSRVRVQFGVRPIRNCCVTDVIPSIHRPGFLIPRTGKRTITVTMPRRWAQCVSSQCPSPDWHYFRRGQPIFVAVYAETVAGYAQYFATVA